MTNFAALNGAVISGSQVDAAFAAKADLDSGGLTLPETAPRVASVAALRARPYGTLTNGALIHLIGYMIAGDGGGGYLRWDSASTAADDSGLVFNPAGNAGAGRWVRTTASRYRLDVRLFGAKGDGLVSSGAINSAAFLAAFAACYAVGGGSVYAPSVGAAYHLASRLQLYQNCVGLVGDGVPNWPGPIGTEAQWTVYGSWIACDDLSGPAIDFHGSGYVEGINFWQTQPTPSATSGVAWTPADVGSGTDPTAWAWCIMFRQNFSWARNVQVANSSYGISFEYPDNANIAGAYCGTENLWLGVFRVGLRVKSANDTMSFVNTSDSLLWQISNPNVVAYMLANKKAVWLKYIDNATFENIESYKTKTMFYFEDGNAVYGTGTLTHAAQNLIVRNAQANMVAQLIDLATSTTTVGARFEGTLGQTDTDTGVAAAYWINGASRYFDVVFDRMDLTAIGNSIMILGDGVGGRAIIDGIAVRNPLVAGAGPGGYGYFGTGVPAIRLAAGSTLSLPGGTQSIVAASGAGPILACASSGNCGIVVANVSAVTPTSP